MQVGCGGVICLFGVGDFFWCNCTSRIGLLNVVWVVTRLGVGVGGGHSSIHTKHILHTVTVLFLLVFSCGGWLFAHTGGRGLLSWGRCVCRTNSSHYSAGWVSKGWGSSCIFVDFIKYSFETDELLRYIRHALGTNLTPCRLVKKC